MKNLIGLIGFVGLLMMAGLETTFWGYVAWLGVSVVLMKIGGLFTSDKQI